MSAVLERRTIALGWLSGLARLTVAALALAAIGTGIWRLQSATAGLEVEQTRVGTVPVTIYRPAAAAAGGRAPAVVLAHGFAGSQGFMQPFAVTLARNGYTAVTFDFPGHGDNPEAFVARIEDETGRMRALGGALDAVVGLASRLPESDGRLALLGHSMAGDPLLRYAATHPDQVGATVLVSPYISPTAPTADVRNLLVVFGALEPAMLHEAGEQAIAGTAGTEVEPGARYGSFEDGSARSLVLSEGAEHIGVLYAPSGLESARDWLNRAFGHKGTGYVEDRGSTLAMLFLGVLALAWPLSGLLPRAATAPLGAGLPWRRLVPAALAPAVLTPVLLRLAPSDYLPILLGDYLALHFAVYGLITAVGTAIARRGIPPAPARGVRGERRILWRGLALATVASSLYAIFAIGLPIDLYVTSFMPGAERLWLFLAMIPGTWLYFVADCWLIRGEGAPRWAPFLTKLLFLLSLVFAVALNLQELFFLIIIVPAILVFFVVYGLMGGWVYRRTLHPLAGSTALALAFAWAMAATFPVVGI